MYGLGIRLGYYLQWFGAIFAAWMAPGEVKGLRFSIDIFVAATFLAVIILTARDVNSLQPVETYVILLLMFGAYLALVPIYLWRLVTRCDPFWDPTRYPLINPGALASNLSFILLIGVLVYQYWFWFARIPVLERLDCQQYGFLFGQVRLNAKVSIVVNALLYVFLGVICLYILLLSLRHLAGEPDPADRRRRSISRRDKYAHIQLLRNMEGWGKLIVALVVTLATELTIQWNELKGVNSLSSAGQTIPFVIGLGSWIRILYIYFYKQASDYDSDSEYSYRPSSGQGPRRPWSGGRGGGGGGTGHTPLPTSQLPSSRIWHGRVSSGPRNYRRAPAGPRHRGRVLPTPVRPPTSVRMPEYRRTPSPSPLPIHQMPRPAAVYVNPPAS
jgi:hypothetical protein